MGASFSAAVGGTLIAILGSGTPVARAGTGADSMLAGSALDLDSTRVAAAASAFAATPSSSNRDLAPSWEPPWNPPGPMHRRRTWERVVLFPQRLATYPLSWAGAGLDRLLGYVETSALVPRISTAAREVPGRYGFAFRPASLGDRTGLGVRVQARSIFLSGPLQNAVVVEHSASSRNYHRTHVQVFGQPAAFEYGHEWRPQERFFGFSMDAPRENASDYATQWEHVRGRLLFAWNRREDDEPRSSLTFWAGPRAIVTRTGREDGIPSFERRFPELAPSRLDRQVEHLTYGFRLANDWRDGRPHWTRGWRVLLQSERFDKPWGVLALRNGQGGGAQFTRTTAELETGFSFMREPRTLRFLGRVIDVGIGANPERMQLEDLSALGGRDGLGGYVPGRFHDVDQLLARVSYIFPLVQKFELALQADAGGVYPNVWRSPRFDELATSYGVYLRPRDRERVYGRIGVEWSSEDIRIRWKYGGEE